MRCQSCGTQNETDSRFCGGCGARLGGTLAPTQKILDERTTGAQQAQPVPPRTSAPVGSQLPPVSLPGTTTTPGTKPAAARSSVAQPAVAAPRSMSAAPGTYQQKPQQPVARHPPSGLQPIQQRPSSSGAAVAPALQSGANPGMGGPVTSGVNRVNTPNPESIGPRTSSAPPGAYTAPGTNGKPVAPEPRHVAITEPPEDEEAPVVQGRRWGLIILVLILDLGLAAAGAWMLMEGLAEASPASGNARTEATPLSPSPEPAAAPEKQAAAPADKPAQQKPLVASDGSAAAPEKVPSAEGSVFLPIDADFARSLAESAAAAKQDKPAVRPNPKPRPPKGGSGSGTGAAPVDPYQQEPGPPSNIGPQPPPTAPPPS